MLKGVRASFLQQVGYILIAVLGYKQPASLGVVHSSGLWRWASQKIK